MNMHRKTSPTTVSDFLGLIAAQAVAVHASMPSHQPTVPMRDVNMPTPEWRTNAGTTRAVASAAPMPRTDAGDCLPGADECRGPRVPSPRGLSPRERRWCAMAALSAPRGSQSAFRGFFGTRGFRSFVILVRSWKLRAESFLTRPCSPPNSQAFSVCTQHASGLGDHDLSRSRCCVCLFVSSKIKLTSLLSKKTAPRTHTLTQSHSGHQVCAICT